MVVLLVLTNAKIQIIFATAKYFQYIIPASLLNILFQRLFFFQTWRKDEDKKERWSGRNTSQSRVDV